MYWALFEGKSPFNKFCLSFDNRAKLDLRLTNDFLFLSVPFHHSPVPGNPTPPLTPNSSGSCVGLPFASPASDVVMGGGPNPMGCGPGIDSKSGLTASQGNKLALLKYSLLG